MLKISAMMRWLTITFFIKSSLLYCARVGFEDLDSARQSQIEGSAAPGLMEEHHSQIGKGDDKDRFGKVAASQNFQNLPARSIFAFPLNFEQIKEHIDRRFADAKIETDPFPHIVIEDILPQELYNALLNHWPKKSVLAAPTSRNWERKHLSIDYKNSWIEEKPDSYELWKEFAVTIVEQILKKKVFELFVPYAHYRFQKAVTGKFVCNAIDITEHQLVEDYPGVAVPPHIDQGYVFAPLIFYFPDVTDIDHTNLGTCLFRHNLGKESTDVCFDKNVTLIKAIPYKANTLVSFIQTPRSWHTVSVPPIPPGYARRTYITKLYLLPKFMTKHYGTTFNLESDRAKHRY
jgi:hypothetical protein